VQKATETGAAMAICCVQSPCESRIVPVFPDETPGMYFAKLFILMSQIERKEL